MEDYFRRGAKGQGRASSNCHIHGPTFTINKLTVPYLVHSQLIHLSSSRTGQIVGQSFLAAHFEEGLIFEWLGKEKKNTIALCYYMRNYSRKNNLSNN
jgi:hypothetical protein